MLSETRLKIPDDDYNKLIQSQYRHIYDYILSKANNSSYPACGYGFFSPKLVRKDGESYVSWEHFDSCD